MQWKRIPKNHGDYCYKQNLMSLNHFNCLNVSWFRTYRRRLGICAHAYHNGLARLTRVNNLHYDTELNVRRPYDLSWRINISWAMFRINVFQCMNFHPATLLFLADSHSKPRYSWSFPAAAENYFSCASLGICNLLHNQGRDVPSMGRT